MPNAFAYAALLGWPLIAVLLFRFHNDRTRAIIWSVVASFLLLPSSMAVDMPGIPPLDKQTVPNLTLLVLVLLGTRERFRFLPENRIGKLLLLAMIVGPFLTALANSDPLRIGARFLPGLTTYDALSSLVGALLGIVPFLVGRACLARPEAHRAILIILLVAGLAYSLPMLFEIRMSPQLHTWVYGYFPHIFAQQMRDGGFRPVVFLQHGLWVAFFAMTVTVVAMVLWRNARARAAKSSADRPAGYYLVAAGYLGAVLVLCKSLGSLMQAFFLVPVVAFTRPRTQVWIAATLVLIACAYPALRGSGVFPIDAVADIARSIDEDRAASLQYRIDNEEMLLARASERPILGWGSWGRNRVYDPETGKDISTTDGFWVITIGSWGWVGYLATFGLLALPILAVERRARKTGSEPEPVTSGLCLLLAINMIEILPNSTLPPWTWLIAGALLGYAESTQESDVPIEQQRVDRRDRRRTIL